MMLRSCVHAVLLLSVFGMLLPLTSATCPERDIDYSGNDIKSIRDVYSWQDCSRQCETSSSCYGWTWVSPTFATSWERKYCYLKNSNFRSRRRTLAGMISGVKGCGAGATSASAYECSFVRGDGVGGSEINIVGKTGNDCINACIERKRSDTSINGVTILQSNRAGCWCEKDMAKVSSSNTYKTCFLIKSKGGRSSSMNPSSGVNLTGPVKLEEYERATYRCEVHLDKTFDRVYWKFDGERLDENYPPTNTQVSISQRTSRISEVSITPTDDLWGTLECVAANDVTSKSASLYISTEDVPEPPSESPKFSYWSIFIIIVILSIFCSFSSGLRRQFMTLLQRCRNGRNETADVAEAHGSAIQIAAYTDIGRYPSRDLTSDETRTTDRFRSALGDRRSSMNSVQNMEMDGISRSFAGSEGSCIFMPRGSFVDIRRSSVNSVQLTDEISRRGSRATIGTVELDPDRPRLPSIRRSTIRRSTGTIDTISNDGNYENELPNDSNLTELSDGPPQYQSMFPHGRSMEYIPVITDEVDPPPICPPPSYEDAVGPV